MMRIKFKNLYDSELAREAVEDRFQNALARFPDLENHRVTFTLSMDNSQFKPGPDLFKVKLVITGKKYSGVILEKSAMSLYLALADLSDHLLERLNRYGDRHRVKNRKMARNVLQPAIKQEEGIYEENSV